LIVQNTDSSFVRRLWPAIAGLTFSAIAVGLAVSAGVAYVQRAQSRGDSATVTTMIVAALVMGSLLVLGTVAFVVGLLIRRRLIARRLRSTVEAFPEGLAFMVTQPRVVAASREDRRRLRHVRAIVIRDHAVTAVGFAGSVASAVDVFPAPVTVARRERIVGAMPFPELQFVLAGEGGPVVLAVLVEDVRRDAEPPFASLDALVARLERELAA
jgi:hypothetical protein